jgi:hypothetical protein
MTSYRYRINQARVFVRPDTASRLDCSVRFGRRGLASIYSEIRDGILPAANRISSVPRATTTLATPRSYRVTALIIACALFMEQMDATVLATALPTMARDFGVRH